MKRKCEKRAKEDASFNMLLRSHDRGGSKTGCDDGMEKNKDQDCTRSLVGGTVPVDGSEKEVQKAKGQEECWTDVRRKRELRAKEEASSIMLLRSQDRRRAKFCMNDRPVNGSCTLVHG